MAEVMVFTHESATAEVLFWNDGKVSISSVYSKDKRKGHATMVLGKVIDYADEHIIDLFLVAHSVGDELDPSTQQLKTLYEKFGFFVVNNSSDFIIMERKSQ